MIKGGVAVKFFKKKSFSSLFNEWFGFENGIDISNETQVLFRRNIVIKNIIFVSNMVYSTLMMIVSFITKTNSNWILTAILFPLTFLINSTLKKMIYTHKDDIMHQTIAMYIACFYMFLSSVIIYMKMKTSGASFGEAGYMLIYYALVIVSLYQNKKLLKTISKWFIVIITILHFTITYNMISTGFEGNTFEQIIEFLRSSAFADIILRTIILASFILVLYVIVAITQYMQDQRRLELIKREEVQDEFTDIVKEMFDVTLSNDIVSDDDRQHIELVSVVAKRFSEILGYSAAKAQKLYAFSRITLDKKVDLNTDKISSKDERFIHLSNQAKLGNEIIKRFELDRLADSIIRTSVEGAIVETQNSGKLIKHKVEEEQVILLSDMYVTLRSLRSYKRPYPNKMAIETLNKEFSQFFDSYLFERFIRFSDEFEKIYDNF